MPDIVSLDMPAAYWRGKAQQAQRAGNPREAVRLYRAALRKHDDNGIRRELAGVYGDMRCLMASDRLLLENLARDAGDADSLYGLARNRSLAGDERAMADLLDLYLRLAPCGEQADQARDILWQLPREGRAPKRKNRALARFRQAVDAQAEPVRGLRLARQSWSRGKTAETARLLSQLYLQLDQKKQALRYALIACRMSPEDMVARQLLATALHENGMEHGSRAAMKQAAGLCKTLDQLPVFCSCALYLGQGALAAELVEQKLTEYPDSADLMLLLATVLHEVPGRRGHAADMARAAKQLDEDNVMSSLLEHAGANLLAEQVALAMRQLQRLGEIGGADSAEEAAERMHGELIRTMRLPIPGMAETAVRLFLKNGDALGLRMAMVENELSSLLYGVILSYMQDAGQPLPCFARVDGRLMLVPPKLRPPYDADLHALIQTLLRDLPESVTLDSVVREVPPLWRRLPLSAKRHFAQSADDIWPAAFSAYLILRGSGSEQARARLKKSRCPRRAGRAFMQLIRRSNKPYEVHRL